MTYTSSECVTQANYSWIAAENTEDALERCRRGETRAVARTDRLMIGTTIIAEKRRVKASPMIWGPHWAVSMVYAAQKTIMDRHGPGNVSDTDDGDAYMDAVAYALKVCCAASGGKMTFVGWTRQWLPRFAREQGTEGLLAIERRATYINGDAFAEAIQLTHEEVLRLGLKGVRYLGYGTPELDQARKRRHAQKERERYARKNAECLPTMTTAELAVLLEYHDKKALVRAIDRGEVEPHPAMKPKLLERTSEAWAKRQRLSDNVSQKVCVCWESYTNAEEMGQNDNAVVAAPLSKSSAPLMTLVSAQEGREDRVRIPISALKRVIGGYMEAAA